jgi:hypothetical protein
MAGIWCVLSHRGENGRGHFTHTHLVYLYFFSNHGIAHYNLHDHGFLVKYEKVYPVGQKKSPQIPITVEFIRCF